MQSLDGIKFAEMVQMGAHHLFQNANYVDSLNVFPVPDGDTGTNMNLSMTSGAKETEQYASEHIGKTARFIKRFTYGSTRKFRCYFIAVIPWLW